MSAKDPRIVSGVSVEAVLEAVPEELKPYVKAMMEGMQGTKNRGALVFLFDEGMDIQTMAIPNADNSGNAVMFFVQLMSIVGPGAAGSIKAALQTFLMGANSEAEEEEEETH